MYDDTPRASGGVRTSRCTAMMPPYLYIIHATAALRCFPQSTHETAGCGSGQSSYGFGYSTPLEDINICENIYQVYIPGIYTWYLVHRFSACIYPEIVARRVLARSFPYVAPMVYNGNDSSGAYAARPCCGRCGAASSGFTATCGSFWRKHRLRSSISASL